MVKKNIYFIKYSKADLENKCIKLRQIHAVYLYYNIRRLVNFVTLTLRLCHRIYVRNVCL